MDPSHNLCTTSQEHRDDATQLQGETTWRACRYYRGAGNRWGGRRCSVRSENAAAVSVFLHSAVAKGADASRGRSSRTQRGELGFSTATGTRLVFAFYGPVRSQFWLVLRCCLPSLNQGRLFCLSALLQAKLRHSPLCPARVLTAAVVFDGPFHATFLRVAHTTHQASNRMKNTRAARNPETVPEADHQNGCSNELTPAKDCGDGFHAIGRSLSLESQPDSQVRNVILPYCTLYSGMHEVHVRTSLQVLILSICRTFKAMPTSIACSTTCLRHFRFAVVQITCL